MAKILVADDNSNVQKTVALALADLSVEVVAVNNGEAAVRKLADISPDLILADIFMPVRNGYEVCEFVKKDARFAQVPVVLLVGAFDPLDEREAERVGADGILKKPFVPPDPLIAMVKALLDRSMGDRLVTVGAPKPAAAMQQGGNSTAAEARLPAPASPEPPPEMPVEEFQAPIQPVSFGEGERPIAFGQLLETPAPEPSPTDVLEPVDDSQILTSSRDASLGEPIFWKNEEPEPEAEDENAEMEQDLSSDPPERPWKPEGLAAVPAPEAPPEPHPTESTEPAAEPFELVREELESAQSPTVVEAGSLIAQDAASQASLTVQPGKVEDLAANPIEWMASVPPPPEPEVEAREAAADWSVTDSEPVDNFDAPEANAPQPIPEPAHSQATPAPTIQSPVAATPNAAPVPPAKPAPSAPPVQQQAKPGIEIPSPNKTQPSLTIKPFPQSVEDTARSIPKQEWADLAASLEPKPSTPVAEKPKGSAPPAPPVSSVPSAANSQTAAESLAPAASPSMANANTSSAAADSPLPPSPDPALVEAVVQRVLEKMRPQVVDIITKEFLRPVVQALVHREITKR